VNLISFSLWGDADLYTLGALANARLAPAIYPGWTLRFYCSPDVAIVDELRALGADVRIMAAPARYAGLFWRFLPVADAALHHVIIRDADSRLNVREKSAVDAWIASSQPFHVMRDHPHHRHAAIMGGMWGCRGGSIPDIADRIGRFANVPAKHEDTRFLNAEIWPLIRDRSLVHSSVPDPLGGNVFPDHPPYPGHVGEIIDPRGEAEARIAVLIPSRGRPAAARATALSARANAADGDRLQLLIGVEPDDAAAYREVFGGEPSWVHVLASGGSYVRAIRELRRAADASIFGLAADDFVFETPGWDDHIRRAVADLPQRLGVIYGDDGWQRQRLATAPFVTAEWITQIGDILPGRYAHMFCDTELTDIARQAGLLHFLPYVRITHRHHLAGAAVIDETYERSAATWDSGQREFERRATDRERLARRLARVSGRQPALVARRLPSAAQRLLLTAACRRDPEAAQAWDEWSARIGADRADAASSRLFPLVWWNMERAGAAPGKGEALTSHYRNSWLSSHALLDAMAGAARTLAAVDVPAVFTGGGVLAACYYEAPALRPCAAIDVMIPPRRTTEAARRLEALGSAVRLRILTQFDAGAASRRDRRIVDRAETLEIGGVPLRVLSPADELLRICLNLSRAGGSVVWVADALALVRKAGARLDWDRFVDEARTRRRAIEVATALDFVRVTFGADVPEAVCRRLNERRAPAAR
jgi:hypothetical protein